MRSRVRRLRSWRGARTSGEASDSGTARGPGPGRTGMKRSREVYPDPGIKTSVLILCGACGGLPGGRGWPAADPPLIGPGHAWGHVFVSLCPEPIMPRRRLPALSLFAPPYRDYLAIDPTEGLAS